LKNIENMHSGVVLKFILLDHALLFGRQPVDEGGRGQGLGIIYLQYENSALLLKFLDKF
jgi:hypothetical protein